MANLLLGMTSVDSGMTGVAFGWIPAFAGMTQLKPNSPP